MLGRATELLSRTLGRGAFGAFQKIVVVAVAGADEIEPQIVFGAEIDGPDFFFARNERHAAGFVAVRPLVRLVHANEAGPTRAAARQGDAVRTQ